MRICVSLSVNFRFNSLYFMILYADERSAVEAVAVVQPHKNKNKIIIKSTFIWRFASSLTVCLAQTIPLVILPPIIHSLSAALFCISLHSWSSS